MRYNFLSACLVLVLFFEPIELLYLALVLRLITHKLCRNKMKQKRRFFAGLINGINNF